MTCLVRVPINIPKHLTKAKDGLYQILAYTALITSIENDDPVYIREFLGESQSKEKVTRIVGSYNHINDQLGCITMSVSDNVLNYLLEKYQHYMVGLIDNSIQNLNIKQFERILLSDDHYEYKGYIIRKVIENYGDSYYEDLPQDDMVKSKQLFLTAVHYYEHKISLYGIIVISDVLCRTTFINHMLMYITFRVISRFTTLNIGTFSVVNRLYDICRKGYAPKSLLEKILDCIPGSDKTSITAITDIPDDFHNLLNENV